MMAAGLTYCSDCGETFRHGEIGICDSCYTKREKARAREEIKQLVEKLVQKELAIRTKDIVHLDIVINGNTKTLTGYWEEDEKGRRFVSVDN